MASQGIPRQTEIKFPKMEILPKFYLLDQDDLEFVKTISLFAEMKSWYISNIACFEQDSHIIFELLRSNSQRQYYCHFCVMMLQNLLAILAAGVEYRWIRRNSLKSLIGLRKSRQSWTRQKKIPILIKNTILRCISELQFIN